MPGRERSVSGRFYRALLFAYPKRFREEYAAHMVQVFENMCREQSRREGAWGLAKVWTRTLLDLVVSAGSERSGGLFAPSSSFVRWAGIAAMLNGFLGLCYVGVFEVLAMPGVLGPDSWDAGLSESARGVLGLSTSLLGAVLATVALAGFYALLDRRSRLALAGLSMFCVSTAVSVAISAYLRLVGPRLGFEDGVPLVFTIGTVVGLIGATGMLLLGVAALRSRTRPLGLWGVLPIVLAVLGTPLPMFLLSSVAGSSIGRWSAILMTLPGILVNVVWMALGYVLWSFGGELRYAAVAIGSAPASVGTPIIAPHIPQAGSARPKQRPATSGGRRGRTVLLVALSSAATPWAAVTATTRYAAVRVTISSPAITWAKKKEEAAGRSAATICTARPATIGSLPTRRSRSAGRRTSSPAALAKTSRRLAPRTSLRRTARR